MLKLPPKKNVSYSPADTTEEDMKSNFLAYYGEELLAEMPEPVKTSIDRHFETTMHAMHGNLLRLQEQYERDVADAKDTATHDLLAFADAGTTVLRTVQSAINEATTAGAPTCKITFEPTLYRPIESKTELQTNLETWRDRFPLWAAHMDAVTTHLASLGRNVELTYSPPSDVRYFAGDDGSFDGYPLDPEWTYKDFGSVTLSFNM